MPTPGGSQHGPPSRWVFSAFRLFSAFGCSALWGCSFSAPRADGGPVLLGDASGGVLGLLSVGFMGNPCAILLGGLSQPDLERISDAWLDFGQSPQTRPKSGAIGLCPPTSYLSAQTSGPIVAELC